MPHGSALLVDFLAAQIGSIRGWRSLRGRVSGNARQRLKESNMPLILHITRRDIWEASTPSGYYRPPSVDTEGFIHCSTIGQTVDTANQFYAGQRDLVLLCIDPDKTEAEVRYEAPACAGDERANSLFPHIYGPLNVSAVLETVEFAPRSDGRFELPAAIAQVATLAGQ